METFVIDTSVVVKFFFEEEFRDIAQDVLLKANQKKIKLLAPPLLSLEIINVFIKKGLSLGEIENALSVFREQVKAKVITIIPSNTKLISKAIEIAKTETKEKSHASFYDSVFHALALLKSCSFLTADKKHYNKTQNPIGSIVLLEDFKCSDNL